MTLGQAVDPVVEQQDLEVDVAPHGVDEVVSADGESVTIPGDDPDRQVLASSCQAGRDGRGTTVDRVHAVGVHVEGETRGASDAGDEDDVLALQPELRQESLDCGKDRVVAAARAPAWLHVAGEVLLGLLGCIFEQVRHAEGSSTRHTEVDIGHRVAPLRLAVASVRTLASSMEVNGNPRTCV